MEKITKKYTNGEVTVVWQPDTCIHSTICWKGTTGLPEVFNPETKPWVNIAGASTERIISQVKKCPSGALSYYMNNNDGTSESGKENVVEAVENGPLLVFGDITVKNTDGQESKKNKVTAFCRCGASGKKPFCDGAHVATHFHG